MRRVCVLLVFLACGPNGGSSGDGGGSGSGIDSTTVEGPVQTATSASSSAAETGFATATVSGGVDDDTGSNDPLADCIIPQGETASVVGTLAGEPVDFRYAWFSSADGGLCEYGYRVVLLESVADLIENADQLPMLLNVFHGALAIGTGESLEPLGAGDYVATFSSPFAPEVDVMVGLTAPVSQAPGTVFEGDFELSDPELVIELSGWFAAPLCPGVGTPPCGE